MKICVMRYKYHCHPAYGALDIVQQGHESVAYIEELYIQAPRTESVNQ